MLDHLGQVQRRVVTHHGIGITAGDVRATTSEILQPNPISTGVGVHELPTARSEVEHHVLRTKQCRDLREERDFLVVMWKSRHVHLGVRAPLEAVSRRFLGQIISVGIRQAGVDRVRIARSTFHNKLRRRGNILEFSDVSFWTRLRRSVAR